MRRARAKPTPERTGNTGLTWALLPLVRKGTVTGAVGSFPPIGVMVVDVVVKRGSVAAGAVTAGRGAAGPGTAGCGAGVAGVTVRGTVDATGRVVAGAVVRGVGLVVGTVLRGVVAGTVVPTGRLDPIVI